MDELENQQAEYLLIDNLLNPIETDCAHYPEKGISDAEAHIKRCTWVGMSIATYALVTILYVLYIIF